MLHDEMILATQFDSREKRLADPAVHKGSRSA